MLEKETERNLLALKVLLQQRRRLENGSNEVEPKQGDQKKLDQKVAQLIPKVANYVAKEALLEE